MSKAALLILVGAMGMNVIADMITMRTAPPVEISHQWGRQ
jgi:hypothetical protein